MPDTAFPLIEPHHAATFQSRGVAVPFTTPLLAGARVRRARRTAVELVVMNPAGARGVYVVHWAGVRAFCHPTLHDTILFRRFAELAMINPTSIRDAVLAVALEGHAGHEALASAQAAIAHDKARQALAHAVLLTKLVEQLDPMAPRHAPPAQPTADLEQRATAALHRLAPSLGRPATELAAALDAIATVFAPIGVGADDRDSRIPRLLLGLGDAYADLSHWLDADTGNDLGGLGQAILAALRAAGGTGAAMLALTRAALKDPTALLKRWTHDEKAVGAAVARCDWLLDGWERVGLLWLSTSAMVWRRNALLEMAALIPALPREVMQWTDITLPVGAMDQSWHVTSREDAWRTGGAAYALIARNEKLIAMST